MASRGTGPPTSLLKYTHARFIPATCSIALATAASLPFAVGAAVQQAGPAEPEIQVLAGGDERHSGPRHVERAEGGAARAQQVIHPAGPPALVAELEDGQHAGWQRGEEAREDVVVAFYAVGELIEDRAQVLTEGADRETNVSSCSSVLTRRR